MAINPNSTRNSKQQRTKNKGRGNETHNPSSQKDRWLGCFPQFKPRKAKPLVPSRPQNKQNTQIGSKQREMLVLTTEYSSLCAGNASRYRAHLKKNTYSHTQELMQEVHTHIHMNSCKKHKVTKSVRALAFLAMGTFVTWFILWTMHYILVGTQFGFHHSTHATSFTIEPRPRGGQ